jgi:hypothetical protein
MHSLCNRLKKRVGLLEKECIEDIHKFEELSDICQSHDWRFVQAEEQFQLVCTNFADQFNRLNGQSNVQLYRAEVATDQRAEFTESVASLRSEFSKLLHDHKSANLKLVETCQKSYITDILKTSNLTMKVLQYNAMLERQLADPNQKSSSSSGCCMGFLPCFRTTPAKAPATAVAPNSFWDQKSSTAAQPAQLIFEHQQIIAELERKVAQLEATTTTGCFFWLRRLRMWRWRWRLFWLRWLRRWRLFWLRRTWQSVSQPLTQKKKDSFAMTFFLVSISCARTNCC